MGPLAEGVAVVALVATVIALLSWGGAVLVRRREPPPERRPIEVVATDLRRLGRGYRATREGVSFAKSEAFRRAYDEVLAEGCEALGVPHLLGILPVGEELDAERVRVERVLHVWGFGLDDAA